MLAIAAAQECGANVLYSEDLSDGQIYGSVQVVNPFTSDVPRPPSTAPHVPRT
jgi:predicted nucleic acid-binding protein